MLTLSEYSLTRRDSILCVDALTLMWAQPAQSIDAIITDLPYGTTACSWDTIIPFEPLWAAVRHCLKPRGVFVTTASQPFTSALVMSNPKWFRYEWVWDKVMPSGFLNAKIIPLKQHENILVFSETTPKYNPQMTIRAFVRTDKRTGKIYGLNRSSPYGMRKAMDGEYDHYYPKTILPFSNANQIDKQHDTQKPVALYEYLIRTYTQPGDLVLDPCCGSGTTALAARNTKRHWICGDTDRGYVEAARLRFASGIDRLNAKEPEPLSDLPLFAHAEAVAQ